jgi:ribosomal RNA-processing protein 17
MGLEDKAAGEEDEEEEDETMEAGPSKPRQEEAEFSDEDQLATVTITEDFDPSSLPTFNPLRSSTSPDPDHPAKPIPSRAPVSLMPASSGRAQAKAKKEKEKVKVKKEREKERSRNMETKGERKKGKAMEAKKRGHKATLAIERDGKSRGRGAGGKRGGKGGRGGASARGGGKRGGKK